MLVVDTSAVVEVLAGREPEPELVRRLAQDGDLHAPHLIDVEFLHALRRLVLQEKISLERAEDARIDFHDLRLVRYPHDHLVDRMWALRDAVTAYDAAFVSLAELLGVPLVTCDSHLAGAPHEAQTELFAPG